MRIARTILTSMGLSMFAGCASEAIATDSTSSWIATDSMSSWIDAYVAGSRALEAGDLDTANAELARALALAPSNVATLHQNAALAARRGELDEAIRLLERAVENGFDDAALLEWDPDLAALRGDGRLVALLNRIDRASSQATTRWSESWIPARLDGNCLAVHPHGTQAAFGGSSVVTVADLEQGGILAQIDVGSRIVEQLVFSRDSDRLGIVTRSRSPSDPIRRHSILDVESRRLVREGAGSLESDPDFGDRFGRRFEWRVTGDGNARVELIERASKRVMTTITDAGSAGELRLVANADASTALVVAGSLGRIHRIDTATGTAEKVYESAAPIADAAFVGTYRGWASLERNGTVSLFDAESRRVDSLRIHDADDGDPSGWSLRLRGGDDVGRLLVVELDSVGVVVETDRGTLAMRRVDQAADKFYVDALICGNRWYSLDSKGRVEVRDLESLDLITCWIPPLAEPSIDTRSGLPAIVHADGEVEITRGPRAGSRIRLGQNWPTTVAIRDDEVWVGTDDSRVFRFSPSNSAAELMADLRDLQVIPASIGCIEFSRDGTLAFLGTSQIGVVAAIEIESRRRLWNFQFSGGTPASVQIRASSDENRITVFGPLARNARLVDAWTGSTILDLGDRGLEEFTPTENPNRLLASGIRGIEVIDVPTDRAISANYLLADGSVIAHEPFGHVFADSHALRQLHRSAATGSDDLATLAPFLLDHKKVRAAAAGIAITPPRNASNLR